MLSYFFNKMHFKLIHSSKYDKSAKKSSIVNERQKLDSRNIVY